ncbi:dUTP diphosphatase [Dehalococcoidia bacterium]|nr:dUTP diphosphatase [Dehalococcoidia bacterium]
MKQAIKWKRLHPDAHIPEQGSIGSSGFDLVACFDGEPRMIGVTPQLVGTGIALEIPGGLDVQVRPRSGLSLQGVVVPLGTIDRDYRGEIFVTMYVVDGQNQHQVLSGDRIAQLVVGSLPDVEMLEVEELSSTERDDSGHGSTGR